MTIASFGCVALDSVELPPSSVLIFLAGLAWCVVVVGFAALFLLFGMTGAVNRFSGYDVHIKGVLLLGALFVGAIKSDVWLARLMQKQNAVHNGCAEVSEERRREIGWEENNWPSRDITSHILLTRARSN